MGKKGNYTEMYKTTSGKLDNQTKAAVLEYLTESDEFHKLVCEITGIERKQFKPDKSYEQLKEEYSSLRDRYKSERGKSSYHLHRWKFEEEKRGKAEAELDESRSHHNDVMGRIKKLLEDIDMPSVESAFEMLKAERANGNLLAERCQLLKMENEKCKRILVILKVSLTDYKRAMMMYARKRKRSKRIGITYQIIMIDSQKITNT